MCYVNGAGAIVILPHRIFPQAPSRACQTHQHPLRGLHANRCQSYLSTLASIYVDVVLRWNLRRTVVWLSNPPVSHHGPQKVSGYLCGLGQRSAPSAITKRAGSLTSRPHSSTRPALPVKPPPTLAPTLISFYPWTTNSILSSCCKLQGIQTTSPFREEATARYRRFE